MTNRDLQKLIASVIREWKVPAPQARMLSTLHGRLGAHHVIDKEASDEDWRAVARICESV